MAIKGFGIRLDKPVWNILLASMVYQRYLGKTHDPEAFDQLIDFLTKKLADAGIHLGDQIGGVKTIFIRASQVAQAKDALAFATTLHHKSSFSRTVAGTWTGDRFGREFTKLDKLDSISLLADAGR